MVRSTRAPVLVVVAVLTMVACGSGDQAVITKGVPGGSRAAPAVTVTTAVLRGPPASGPARPVCDMISRDEVARILGNTVSAGVGDGKYCAWGTLVDKGSSADLKVSVPAQGRGQAECAIQQASLPKEATFESVSGVGSSGTWAWQRVAILLQGTLVGCYPEVVMRVLMTGERDQTVLRDQAVKLAQLAKERL